jgi:hypothetical protein
MPVPLKELKILLLRSGNRCAFPGCGEVLVLPEGNPEEPVVIGEVAHIVAESIDGPRGDYPLPVERRGEQANLLLLCAKHHKIIDEKPPYYTVERLRQLKEDHENRIAGALSELRPIDPTKTPPKTAIVTETLHSTLLPVLAMPSLVYGAKGNFKDGEERTIAKSLAASLRSEELCPFVIRNNTLFAFNNLRYRGGPFSKVVDSTKVEQWRSRDWWLDNDRSKWYADLLNRSLNKLTGRLSLMLDKDHRRYFFQSKNPGEESAIRYRPLNQKSLISRKVVWQPINKRTGLPRPRWHHLAVGISFHRVDSLSWCFSIRPELRITKDGLTPLESSKIGGAVTRAKSRMFNYDLLEFINFWRDFLSGGRPRITMGFGLKQHIVISTTMMSAEVAWPGIPEEHAKDFRNIEYEEDLFSSAELESLERGDGDEADEWEEDEEPGDE